MFLPKRYGQSKIETCPFCERQATTTNRQDISVCARHQQSMLNEMKCLCGEYLETCTGKFGLYFRCARCGNVNRRKVFEINAVKDVNGLDLDTVENQKEETKNKFEEHRERKEITITSRDVEWFD